MWPSAFSGGKGWLGVPLWKKSSFWNRLFKSTSATKKRPLKVNFEHISIHFSILWFQQAPTHLPEKFLDTPPGCGLSWIKKLIFQEQNVNKFWIVINKTIVQLWRVLQIPTRHSFHSHTEFRKLSHVTCFIGIPFKDAIVRIM